MFALKVVGGKHNCDAEEHVTSFSIIPPPLSLLFLHVYWRRKGVGSQEYNVSIHKSWAAPTLKFFVGCLLNESTVEGGMNKLGF